jgi:hypothetical protein
MSKKKKEKKELPRGWHVPPYLPIPGGVDEEEAHRLANGLQIFTEPVSPEDES